MFDIVAVGELLIDMTPKPGECFQANPGGAPCNFLTMAQKMGAKTSFIGKVGADAFGEKLRNVLIEQGIDTHNLVLDSKFGTTLAFVHLSREGDRSFSFYRKGCADIMLTQEDVDLQLLDETTVFHFGSLSLTDEPCRSTVFYLLEVAASKQKIITYDPNYRPALWESEAEAIHWMMKGMAYANIVKVSDEELVLLTKTQSYGEGCAILHQMGVGMIFVTLGEKGVYYSYPKGHGIVEGIPAKVVDTTGAGDTFFGATIYQIISLTSDYQTIAVGDLEKILYQSNVAAAICIEGYGGIPSIPSKEQIKNRMKELNP